MSYSDAAFLILGQCPGKAFEFDYAAVGFRTSEDGWWQCRSHKRDRSLLIRSMEQQVHSKVLELVYSMEQVHSTDRQLLAGSMVRCSAAGVAEVRVEE